MLRFVSGSRKSSLGLCVVGLALAAAYGREQDAIFDRDICKQTW